MSLSLKGPLCYCTVYMNDTVCLSLLLVSGSCRLLVCTYITRIRHKLAITVLLFTARLSRKIRAQLKALSAIIVREKSSSTNIFFKCWQREVPFLEGLDSYCMLLICLPRFQFYVYFAYTLLACWTMLLFGWIYTFKILLTVLSVKRKSAIFQHDSFLIRRN